MKESLVLVLLVIGSSAEHAWADFAGPLRADNAASPDGKLVVRVLEDESAKQTGAQRSYLVRFYEFDVGKDSYVRCSEFRMKERPGQLAFLSNAGDVVMISLRETDAIRLYSRDGNLVKSWNLNEFLTASQIEACAKTGATLQWLDEGAFLERSFYFKGPSHRIRALDPSFTIMRGADAKVIFSGLLGAENATIHLNEAKEP